MKKYFSKEQAIFLGILFFGPILYGLIITSPINSNDFAIELANMFEIPVPPPFEMKESEIFGMWLGLSIFPLLSIMFALSHFLVKKGLDQPLFPSIQIEN